MTQPNSRIIPSLLVTSLLAGCGDSGTGNSLRAGSPVPDMDPSVVILADMPTDPCTMIRVPVTASNAPTGIDRSISRHQHALSDTAQPLSRLEWLGWSFVAKARDSRDAGYYTLAQQAAGCIERTAPGAAEALLLKGHVLHNLHRFGEAEQLARQLVEQRGLWLDYALLGDVLLERGTLMEAADAYQRVMDQRPGPQAYARAAQLRWLTGDLGGAIEMMATAVRTTSARTAEAAVWARVQLARYLLQAGDLPAVDAVLAQALSMQPDYPPALHARGRLRLAQERPLEAIPSLERAVGLDPLPEFRWSLYEALVDADRPVAAEEQRAALLKQGAMEDRRTFALFLASTGAAADTALRLARLELEMRQDPLTLDAVAWAFSSAGRHDQALDFSRLALAQGTRDARLFLHAGVIAARIGDNRRAMALLADTQAIQQTLLPSERRRLVTEFAALQPRVSDLANGHPSRQLPPVL